MNLQYQSGQVAKGISAAPWTRWWWMGSAVNEAELTRHLELYASAGIGGVEICPIYGAKGAEAEFVPFLSPRWKELLRHTLKEACRLGIGVDLTLGTGWPYGGPMVSAGHAPRRLEIRQNPDGTRFAEEVPTGQQVKRAAPGGEGNVMCPYTRAALAEYVAAFEDLFAGEEYLPRCLFYDSFEVFGADWAEGLRERIRQRAGFDPYDYLAELEAKEGTDRGYVDTARRVLGDYRDALFSMLLEESIRPWAGWAQERGLKVRYQAHGAPGNLLDLYAAADIPETEVFGSSRFDFVPVPESGIVPVEPGYPLANQFASSAAHLTGRQLVSSETFTWHREHFSGFLADMKPEIDQLFLTGINHIFFHGSTYSPKDAVWPGRKFYASTHFDPDDPIWRNLPAMNGYIRRCQEILQTARMENEILLYYPYHDIASSLGPRFLQCSMHDLSRWLTGTSFGAVAGYLWDKGYHADFVSDRLLEEAVCQDGLIRIGGGEYRTLLVPPADFLPERTLEMLMALAEQGARILYLDRLPGSFPGLGNRGSGPRLAARLQDSSPVCVAQSQLQTALKEAGVMSGFGGREAGLEGLRLLLTEGKRAVFLCNLSGRTYRGHVPLNFSAPGAVVFDPLYEHKGRLPALAQTAQAVLQPGQSLFIFEAGSDIGAAGAVLPTWRWHDSAAGVTLPVNGCWQVDFVSGGPAMPDSVQAPALAFWTDFEGQVYQDFSGTVRYRAEFDLPCGFDAVVAKLKAEKVDAQEVILKFPDVQGSVRCMINGQSAPVLWCRPWEAPVGRFLRQGRNVLELEVTGTGANRISATERAGVPWKCFYEINFVNLHYQPFDAAVWPAQPSGIAGELWLLFQ